MSKYKPNKDEFFFKKSSLACYLDNDRYKEEIVRVYDRRTKRIVFSFSPAMVTLRHFMDLTPMKRKK